MYLIPQPHKCNKCGHIADVDENDDCSGSAYTKDSVAGITVIRVCPVCWQKFLLEHVGVMVYIQNKERG
jgi:hypothetical protein